MAQPLPRLLTAAMLAMALGAVPAGADEPLDTYSDALAEIVRGNAPSTLGDEVVFPLVRDEKELWGEMFAGLGAQLKAAAIYLTERSGVPQQLTAEDLDSWTTRTLRYREQCIAAAEPTLQVRARMEAVLAGAGLGPEETSATLALLPSATAYEALAAYFTCEQEWANATIESLQGWSLRMRQPDVEHPTMAEARAMQSRVREAAARRLAARERVYVEFEIDWHSPGAPEPPE